MYLTIVDETGNYRLLIMLGDGQDARCWVTDFSQRIDPILLQEIFRHHFLIINFMLFKVKEKEGE